MTPLHTKVSGMEPILPQSLHKDPWDWESMYFCCFQSPNLW